MSRALMKHRQMLVVFTSSTSAQSLSAPNGTGTPVSLGCLTPYAHTRIAQTDSVSIGGYLMNIKFPSPCLNSGLYSRIHASKITHITSISPYLHSHSPIHIFSQSPCIKNALHSHSPLVWLCPALHWDLHFHIFTPGL